MVSCTCPRCQGLGKEKVIVLEKLPAYSEPFQQVTWSLNNGYQVCSYCMGTGIVDGYGRSLAW